MLNLAPFVEKGSITPSNLQRDLQDISMQSTHSQDDLESTPTVCSYSNTVSASFECIDSGSVLVASIVSIAVVESYFRIVVGSRIEGQCHKNVWTDYHERHPRDRAREAS